MHIEEMDDGLLLVEYAADEYRPDNEKILNYETREQIEAHLKDCEFCRRQLYLQRLVEEVLRAQHLTTEEASERRLIRELGLTQKQYDAEKEKDLKKFLARIEREVFFNQP